MRMILPAQQWRLATSEVAASPQKLKKSKISIPGEKIAHQLKPKDVPEAIF